MRRRTVVKIFFLVLFLGACLLVNPDYSTAQKVILLNYSNFFPAPHQNSIIADQWCKEIEKRTNGRSSSRISPVEPLLLQHKPMMVL